MLLHLSVFVLLLAFFILLSSISTFQQQKAGAVIGSLRDSFAAGRLGEGTGDAAERAEALREARAEVEAIGRLFAADLAVAEIEASGDGSGMVVTVPDSELFAEGAMRRDRAELLDRAAAALVPRKAGIQVRLEFLSGYADGSGPETLDGMSADPRLVSRAGLMARTLLLRGADPAYLTVGIEKRQAGWSRFLFTVRDPAAPALRLPAGEGRP